MLLIDIDTKNPPRFKRRVHSLYLLMKSDKVLEDFRITSRKTAISICGKKYLPHVLMGLIHSKVSPKLRTPGLTVPKENLGLLMEKRDVERDERRMIPHFWVMQVLKDR